jgi:hypothetical protein
MSRFDGDGVGFGQAPIHTAAPPSDSDRPPTPGLIMDEGGEFGRP